MEPLPDGSEVASFLGRAEDERLTALADEHVELIAQLVRSYTNGRGFSLDGSDCEPELRAVIIAATARLVTNPAQIERETADGYTAVGGFSGFSLPELSALNRHRRRTA